MYDLDLTRAQWIADARTLIDFIEANPELPLNTFMGLAISYHPMDVDSNDDDGKKGAVDAVADMLGVAVTPPGPGSHYEARKSFGSASYKAVGVLKDYSDRDRAIRELGNAALAEREAAEANNARVEREFEANEANEAWLDAHPDEFVDDAGEDGAL